MDSYTAGVSPIHHHSLTIAAKSLCSASYGEKAPTVYLTTTIQICSLSRLSQTLSSQEKVWAFQDPSKRDGGGSPALTPTQTMEAENLD